ncbi:hypothetical protein ACC674_39580, partial [Rhizobium ruizarguesonis]
RLEDALDDQRRKTERGFVEKQQLRAIKKLNEAEGLTVFLVEQNAFAALRISQRAYVMVKGKVTMSGSGKELLANPE